MEHMRDSFQHALNKGLNNLNLSSSHKRASYGEIIQQSQSPLSNVLTTAGTSSGILLFIDSNRDIRYIDLRNYIGHIVKSKLRKGLNTNADDNGTHSETERQSDPNATAPVISSDILQYQKDPKFKPLGIKESPGGKLLLAYNERDVYAIQINSLFSKQSSTSTSTNTCRVLRVARDIFEMRPGLKVVQVSWHPQSDGHLYILTSDTTLWIFDLAKSVVQEEQRYNIDLSDNEQPISFAFGAGKNWESFTLYFLTSTGKIYALCPVAPYGLKVRRNLIDDLAHNAKISIFLLEHGMDTKNLTHNKDEYDPVSAKGNYFNSLEEMVQYVINFSEIQRNELRNRAIDEMSIAREKRKLQWLQDHVVMGDKEETSEGLIMKPEHAQKIPSIQGPLYIINDDENLILEWSSINIMDTGSFPVFLKSSCQGDIHVLIGINGIEASWDDKAEEINSEFGLMSSVDDSSLLSFEKLCLLDPGSGSKEKQHIFFHSNSNALNHRHIFVRSNDGLYQFQFPWIRFLQSEDLVALSNAQNSSLVPVLNSNIDGNPKVSTLGCAIMFVPVVGFVAIVLSSSYNLEVCNANRPFNAWVRNENFPSLAREALESLRLRDSESIIFAEESFDVKLQKVLGKFLPNPKLQKGALESYQSSAAIFNFLQKYVMDFQEGNADVCHRLSALLIEHSEGCISKQAQQIEDLKKAEMALSEAEVNFQSLKSKVSNVMEETETIKKRIQSISNKVTGGYLRLTSAERQFSQRMQERTVIHNEMRNRVTEMESAVDKIVFANSKSHDSNISLREIDQKRIHAMLLNHADQISRVVNKLKNIESSMEQ